MRNAVVVIFWLLGLGIHAQPRLIKTIQLPYPVYKIIHYPRCGDKPLYLCKKTAESMESQYIVVNGEVEQLLDRNENLLHADQKRLYTYLNISVEKVVLRKYEIKNNRYDLIKEVQFDRLLNGVKYTLHPLIIDEKLQYFAFQPFSSTKVVNAKLRFIDADLTTAFEIEEELSSFNIHCFGHDSILILKEYINSQQLTSHLYDHNGKLLADESFLLSFKPQRDAPVFEYLDDDGIVFVVEQSDTQKTHVMKYRHDGTLVWDYVLDDYFYNFEEHKDVLVSYGGGNRGPQRLVFINEHTGKLLDDLNLEEVYSKFAKEHKLEISQTSFFPLSLNSNPEKTWLTLIINIYNTTQQAHHWDRVMIYHSHSKVDYIDLDLPATEMPKVVPTDKNHLVIGVGKKIQIYSIK